MASKPPWTVLPAISKKFIGFFLSSKVKTPGVPGPRTSNNFSEQLPARQPVSHKPADPYQTIGRLIGSFFSPVRIQLQISFVIFLRLPQPVVFQSVSWLKRVSESPLIRPIPHQALLYMFYSQYSFNHQKIFQ